MANRYTVNLYYHAEHINFSLDESFDDLKFKSKSNNDVVHTYTICANDFQTVKDLVNKELSYLGREFHDPGKFYKIEILAG